MGVNQVKKYLGILDSYGVSWSVEKAARDTLQNFFDGNSQTLDGIDVIIEKNGMFGNYSVRINGDAEYDFKRLLHLGGTTKEEEKFTAGGIGEGAKILALVLLRDYDFSKVRFGSQDWSVEFSLDEMPMGEYIEKRKGLFAGVTKKEFARGNFIEFETNKKEYAEAFAKAKDFFYHSANEDFKNPTLDIKKVGGFKFLGGRNEKKEAPKGNFYFAGQRRHFDAECWGNIEFVSIWAYDNNLLRRDRDRGLVTKHELFSAIVPEILNAAKTKDLERVIYEIEPIWPENSGWEDPVGPKLLESIARELFHAGSKLKFDDKYVARVILGSKEIEDALEHEGYVICNSALAKIGMKTVSERFKEMQRHYRIGLNEQESKRVLLLYETALSFGKDAKEIWIYDRKDEKSIVEGQYNETFIWLSRQILNSAFDGAVATYLHELDHQYGDDFSRKFSLALTNTIETVIKRILEKPEVYRTLEQQWEKA